MSDPTLENFMRQLLLTYEGIPACLSKIVDTTTPEYAAFHRISLSEHIGFIEIRLRKETYWLTRVSNLRNTAGYDLYRYVLASRVRGEEDDPNIAFRFFRERWLDWHTVNMNIGSIK